MSDASHETGRTDERDGATGGPPSLGELDRVEAFLARPRLWPTALAIPLALLSSVVVTMLCLQLAIDLPEDEEARRSAIEEFSLTRIGSVLTIAPGLLALLVVALIASALSPTAWNRRLRLDAPALGWREVGLLVVATPAITFPFQIVLSLAFEKPSEHIQFLSELMTAHTGAFQIVMVLMISVLPGFAEELFFRGFVQTRVEQRFGWRAIPIVGVLFATAHGDPMHAIGVLPIGIWLSWLAWVTRSVWPSIACHTLFNAGNWMLARVATDPSIDVASGEVGAAGRLLCSGAFLSLSAAPFAVLIAVRETRRRFHDTA